MIAVGVGARAGTTPADLAAAVGAALAEAGLDRAEVTVLATLDRRATEPGPGTVAREAGWRLAVFPAAELAACAASRALTPSARAGAAVGTPSVAEAAALLAAGPKAGLVLPRRIFHGVTVAIAGTA